MSHPLKLEPNAAVRKARELARAEIAPVKQAIASGAGKSPIGSFRSEYKAQPSASKQRDCE